MFTHNARLAWQFYCNEKKSPHQRFLLWTQIVLMVFIVTISQSSDSIQRYLSYNLSNLLGADLVISQQRSLTNAQQLALADMSEELVLTRSISTTLTHKGEWQRATLKAVGEDYPLQGELRTSDSLGGEETTSMTGPEVGNIWLDTRLLTSLSLQVGDKLSISNHAFTVSRILQHEPDRLMEGHNVNMRALMHSQDLAHLNFSEDIVRHRYLFATSTQQLKRILEWQKEHLPAAQVHYKQGAHPLALFWKRTENFLGLASIILFFMAAIAIQQLNHVKMQKEQFFTAVCLSLGSSKKACLQISVLKWLLSLLFLLPFVLLISGLSHWLIIQYLSTTFENLQWQVNIALLAKTIAASTAIFAVFHTPVWIGLKQSSVAQLIHNTNGKSSSIVALTCAVIVLTGLAAAYSDNYLLTTMVLSAMAISVLLILATSWVSLTVGERLTTNVSGLMPFALYMMRQRLLSKSTQILGVGLCAFLLLFTLMLLRDLGANMQSYQRQHDGNLLVSQASVTQMADIETWAQKNDIEIRQNKSFMYAKLTHINEQHLSEFSESPSESLATFSRSIRLHSTDVVPSNNRVVDGQWWQEGDDWQKISIEQEVMTDLGLNLGDSLRFFVGSKRFDFTIVASHEYRPGAGSITFWVQMPAAALHFMDAPQYTMASLELTKPQFSMLGQLWQKHPSLRMSSLEEMTKRFDTTLAMVTQVISGFSILIILLASIVIVSSIHAFEAKEKKKNSIIMSFGFSKNTCLKLNVIEWLVTGFIAASGAIMGTWFAGILIYDAHFSMSYQPDFVWLLATLLLILSVVALLGILASKNTLSSSIKTLMSE